MADGTRGCTLHIKSSIVNEFSLLHRLFLDHDIVLFLDNIENLCSVLNTCTSEKIMEYGAFAPKDFP